MSKTESDDIKIRLYYWNARGCVQAVRYMFEDMAAKHVDYKQDFEILEKAAEI